MMKKIVGLHHIRFVEIKPSVTLGFYFAPTSNSIQKVILVCKQLHVKKVEIRTKKLYIKELSNIELISLRKFYLLEHSVEELIKFS